MGFFSVSADEIHLLAVLFIIYLSDCLLPTRSSAIMLYSRFWGTALRPRDTRSSVAFARHFWFIRPLLPPLGISLCKTLPRCSLGNRGIGSASPVASPAHAAESPHFIAYDDIINTEVRGSSFEINGVCWLKGKNKELRCFQKRLNRIINSADRAQAIAQAVREDFHQGSSSKKQIGDLLTKTALLNTFCSAYALCLLIWLPFSLCRMPTEWLLWWVGLPILLLHISCGILFLRTHAKLVPNKKSSRWESFIKMLLCPPMMVRAVDVATDAVDVKGDASSVLIACTDPSQWRPFIRHIWQSSYPYIRTHLSPEAAQAMYDFSQTYRSALSENLKTHGVDPASLEIDASTVLATESYCPRCGAVFNNQTETCNDCDGVRLQQGKKEKNVF